MHVWQSQRVCVCVIVWTEARGHAHQRRDIDLHNEIRPYRGGGAEDVLTRGPQQTLHKPG